MRVLIWIAAILAAIAALLFLLRLRLTAEYGEEGPSLTAALGAVPLLKLPKPKGAEKAEGKKRPEKKKKETTEKKDKGGPEPGFKKTLQIIRKLLGKLKRRLCVDELTIRYLSAGDDPAATALIYGAANAAAAALARAVESLFRVKQRDIRAGVSFTESAPRVYARLRLSVSLGVLLWLLAAAAVQRKLAQWKAGSK